MACTELHPQETYEELKQIFKDELLYPDFMGFDEIETQMQRDKNEVLDELNDNFHQLITETISELENWDCFQSADEKIGRNERCPWGSGLKYKKCCLR